MFTAYPFAKDKILNMQDVDQMVENLLRVYPNDNIEIQPSVINSYSDLNLLHVPAFLFRSPRVLTTLALRLTAGSSIMAA
jgi:hemolysin activation/secretion protein